MKNTLGFFAFVGAGVSTAFLASEADGREKRRGDTTRLETIQVESGHAVISVVPSKK